MRKRLRNSRGVAGNDAGDETRDKNMSTIYRRNESNWIGSTGDSKDAGINYWRKQARDIFARHPGVEIVEIVKSGRKTDSEILRRGSKWAPAEAYVIIASTGGRWGKSRRNFRPVTAGMAR